MSKNAFHPRSKKEQKAELVQLYQRAAALQSVGRLPEAQAVCRQLLKYTIDPRGLEGCGRKTYGVHRPGAGCVRSRIRHAADRITDDL